MRLRSAEFFGRFPPQEQDVQHQDFQSDIGEVAGDAEPMTPEPRTATFGDSSAH